MSKLVYKVRNNNFIKDKPKVFFCAGEEDCKKYLHSISNDILSMFDCSIWYDSEPNGKYDEKELLYNLSQMKLFVIPITTKFLHTKNRAYDIEYKYAKKNNIPILPIMVESNLIELFNKKCGDLQYLDKTIDDVTAISYKKKLNDYLNSVLVDDKTIDLIKNSFSAYIFLSYRKKDRKYANELMKRIHENTFCRDIAIWYDEFLIPGEDFNDIILESLKKSVVFALNVTPNIVNEKNYIMTKEYPAAIDNNKSVIAIETVKTNINELKEKYDGIPNPIDYNDSTKLKNELIRVLDKYIEDNNKSNHIYYIGLAYLFGIDVEIDKEKAKKLVESAAKKGFIDAIKKIVNMYRTGDGVKKNYLKGIKWQKTLSEIYYKDYKDGKSKLSIVNYIESLKSLGDYYIELCDYKNAQIVYQRLLAFINNTNTLQYKYVCYFKLSYIYKCINNNKLSIDYLNLNIKECNRVLKLNTDINVLQSLMQSYTLLADLCVNIDDNKKGILLYKKSIKICKMLLKNKIDWFKEIQHQLSNNYNKLSFVYIKTNEYKKALLYAKKSNLLYIEISKDGETPFLQYDLVNNYINLGNIYFLSDKFNYSIKMFEKGIDICKNNEADNTIALNYSFAKVYNSIADVYYKKEMYCDSANYYKKSIKYYKKLINIDSSIDNLNMYSYCNFMLGKSYYLLNEKTNNKEYFSLSKQYFLLSNKIDNEIIRKVSYAYYKNNMTMKIEYFLDLLVIFDKLNPAKEHLKYIIDIYNTNLFSTKEYLMFLCNLTDIYRLQNNDEYVNLILEIKKEMPNISDIENTNEYNVIKSSLLFNLGFYFYHNIKDFEEAKSCYMFALEKEKDAAKKTFIHFDISKICELLKEYDNAINHYNEMLNCMKNSKDDVVKEYYVYNSIKNIYAIKKEKELDIYADLSIVSCMKEYNKNKSRQVLMHLVDYYKNSIEIKYNMKKSDECFKLIKNGLKIIKDKYHEDCTFEVRNDLAKYYLFIANIYKKHYECTFEQKYIDTSINYYNKAYKVFDDIYKDTKSIGEKNVVLVLFDDINNIGNRNNSMLCLNKLGDVYMLLKEYNKAYKYYYLVYEYNLSSLKKALRSKKRVSTLTKVSSVINSTINIGKIYKLKNNNSKANNYFKKGLNLAIEWQKKLNNNSLFESETKFLNDNIL